MFTSQHFLDKFTAIPEEQWCEGKFTDDTGRHCASGFCDASTFIGVGTERGDLARLFVKVLKEYPAQVNDGKVSKYNQPTPKQRVIAALNDIQLLEQQTQ